MATFCKECGKELKEGTKFCTSCGAAVGADPVMQPEIKQEVTPSKPAQPVDGKAQTVNRTAQQKSEKPSGGTLPAILLILHILFYLVTTLTTMNFSSFFFHCLSLTVSGIMLAIALFTGNKMLFKAGFIAGAVISLISFIVAFVTLGAGGAIAGKNATFAFIVLNVLLFLKITGVGIPDIVLIILSIVAMVIVSLVIIQSSVIIGVIICLLGVAGYTLMTRYVVKSFSA